MRWISFAEHPKGVNYVPRFDEKEDPLDLPYDKTSVWYDPNVDAHGGLVQRKEAAANADADAGAAGEAVVEEDAEDSGDLEPIRGRDHETHDVHENLDQHHEELRRAIKEAEEKEEAEARPVISGAEAHANAVGSGQRAEDDERARAAAVNEGFAGGALRGGSLFAGAARKLIEHRPVVREHGFSQLPLPVKAAAVGLVVGLIVAIALTTGTGRGALRSRYGRHRRRSKAM